MGYLIAAYLVVALGIGGYTLHLEQRRRALRARRSAPARPRAEAG